MIRFSTTKTIAMQLFTKKGSLTCLLALALLGAKAQIDPHFSQYYVYPSWLNPALTGVMDGDYRVSGIYRSQWGNISTPFSTPGVSADFNTNKSINYGISILNQSAGNGGYNYTTAYANIAYTGIRFGTQGFQRLAFGMQFGLIQRRFNPSKLTFGDQWNPIFGFNQGTPTADNIQRPNASNFDAGAGLLYYDAQPGKKANIFAGISASHLTRPEDKFSASGNEKIPVRYTFHGGVRLAISETFTLTPNVLYLRQGVSEEKMVGAFASIKADTQTDFLLGANYRIKDAISPFVGFNHKNLVLGLAYDINTSDLGKLARGANSFEISLSFIGRKKAKTPEVEFICPRL